MKRVLFGLVAAGILLLPGTVGAQDSTLHASARLTGFQENTPKLTDATGTFSATVTSSTLTYELTFSNLSATVTQAHIHFAQPAVNGGIIIWLCQTATSPSPVAGTPTCPQAGTVKGTVTAADIQAVAGQTVGKPDFGGVMRILRAGDGYANVHTTNFLGGEIRGAIRVDGED